MSDIRKAAARCSKDIAQENGDHSRIIVNTPVIERHMIAFLVPYVEAVRILKNVTWIEDSEQGVDCCSWCCEVKPNHVEGCKLATALKALEGES